MTVTYTREVATQKTFGVFWKLLFKWKGSVYKLVWPELFLYCTMYYILRAIYQFALNEEHRRVFEKICLHVQDYSDLIPLSFVLGFYVSIVMQRWWDQYRTIPWPDSLAVFVSSSIHGQDERARLMRRTILRYANLTFVITLSMISPQVKKRFPTYEHLVEAGFMNSNEKLIFEHLNDISAHPKYWMPIVWAGSIVTRARKEGRIRDDFAVKTIMDALNSFRSGCGILLTYDTLSLPLVYTQVVSLAVYTFFVSTLFGSQFLDPAQEHPKNYIDLYIPLFTLLQFFFYMGWLKVAETLVNPFGEDDDDFEINWMIDRNLQVSYLIVDEMHNEHPELLQDIYWEDGFPQDIPYTVASEQFISKPPQGSTAKLDIPEDQQKLLPSIYEEQTEFDLENKHERVSLGGRSYQSKRPGTTTSSRRLSLLGKLTNKIIPDGDIPENKLSSLNVRVLTARGKSQPSESGSPTLSTHIEVETPEQG